MSGPFRHPDPRPTPPGPPPTVINEHGPVAVNARDISVNLVRPPEGWPDPQNGCVSTEAMAAEKQALARALSYVTPESLPNMPDFGRPAVPGLNDVVPGSVRR